VKKSGKLIIITGWEKVITTAFDMSFEVTPGQVLDITVTGNPGCFGSACSIPRVVVVLKTAGKVLDFWLFQRKEF
jgi:hypothetical protein